MGLLDLFSGNKSRYWSTTEITNGNFSGDPNINSLIKDALQNPQLTRPDAGAIGFFDSLFTGDVSGSNKNLELQAAITESQWKRGLMSQSTAQERLNSMYAGAGNINVAVAQDSPSTAFAQSVSTSADTGNTIAKNLLLFAGVAAGAYLIFNIEATGAGSAIRSRVKKYI